MINKNCFMGSLHDYYFPNYDDGKDISAAKSFLYPFNGHYHSLSHRTNNPQEDAIFYSFSFPGYCGVQLGSHLNSILTHQLEKEVYDASDLGSMTSFISTRIENHLEDESFFVCNLNVIIRQFQQWKRELPMVEPFYAVKCNPDTAILRLLASLGCGFDCATMGEMDLVINGLGSDLSFGSRGLSRGNIIYAHPAKMVHMIQFAIDNDVRMTVFDGEDELYKISSLDGASKFELLLRLATDDTRSVCKFSKKFGCPVGDAPRLLDIAKSLRLNVVGVSFHVGSGCGDPAAYTTALKHSRLVFDAARALRMPDMRVVDIGGGFPGDAGYGGPGMPSFADLAAAVREGIQSFGIGLGRPLSEIRFIAEPGRYFVSASTVLATKIFARRGGKSEYQALYVDDGVYGSFNDVVFDHFVPVPIKLQLKTNTVDRVSPVLQDEDSEVDVLHATREKATAGGAQTTKAIPTAVFGPTCDGLDQMCSMESTSLARCAVGDWLVWENMGAYTHVGTYVFNGYTHIPERVYCVV